MQLGLIGLGKMGFNMRERLRKGGHEVIGFDPRPEVTDVPTLGALAEALSAPRVVWVMVPSGPITNDTIVGLAAELSEGDLVIDGGNSRYTEDGPHAKLLGEKGIGYIDAGVSGGIWGLTEGYGLMVGADADIDQGRMPNRTLPRRPASRVRDRASPGDVGIACADHEAISLGQSPDAAGHAGVDVSDSLLAHSFCVRPVFGVAGVAAIDHQVALAEFSGKPDDRVVGDRAGRHHHPHHTRGRQRLGECAQRRDVGDFRPRIEADHFVPALAQTLAHVEAHFAETDQPELHVRLFRGVGPVSREPHRHQ